VPPMISFYQDPGENPGHWHLASPPWPFLVPPRAKGVSPRPSYPPTHTSPTPSITPVYPRSIGQDIEASNQEFLSPPNIPYADSQDQSISYRRAPPKPRSAYTVSYPEGVRDGLVPNPVCPSGRVTVGDRFPPIIKHCQTSKAIEC